MDMGGSGPPAVGADCAETSKEAILLKKAEMAATVQLTTRREHPLKQSSQSIKLTDRRNKHRPPPGARSREEKC
jgi:hypothetical protein